MMKPVKHSITSGIISSHSLQGDGDQLTAVKCLIAVHYNEMTVIVKVLTPSTLYEKIWGDRRALTAPLIIFL